MIKERKNSIILIIILIIICLVLIGMFLMSTLKQSGVILDKETKKVMSQFDKYYNSKDRTMIYYASSGCNYCEMQDPILETIVEDYDIDYLEIDSATLGFKQREEILAKLDIEQATPTTVIVKEGKVIDVAEGYMDGREFIEFLIDNKILPEDAVYSKESNLTFINYEEYTELITKKETQVLVVGQKTCSNCIAIKPALNSIAGDYDLTINYMDLTKITESEYDSFKESLTTIEYNDPEFIETGSLGVPLTLILENGKVIDYISGQRTKSQLVREFKKAGLISE